MKMTYRAVGVLKINLKEIIERRQYIETKLYTNDDEGVVVSSYNISISIEFIRRE